MNKEIFERCGIFYNSDDVKEIFGDDYNKEYKKTVKREILDHGILLEPLHIVAFYVRDTELRKKVSETLRTDLNRESMNSENYEYLRTTITAAFQKDSECSAVISVDYLRNALDVISELDDDKVVISVIKTKDKNGMYDYILRLSSARIGAIIAPLCEEAKKDILGKWEVKGE